MKVQIPRFVTRYPFQFWTTLSLFVWILFFDGSNLLGQFRLWKKQNALEDERIYYQKEIRKVKVEAREVLGTAKSREQFAREKYFMKQKSETIFVLVDKDGKPLEE